MWLAHDWVVSWSVVKAPSSEYQLDVREIEHCCITAVCWNSFFGFVVKTVGSYYVSRFGRQNRNSGGRRCRVYERCRVCRRCRVWTDVEPVEGVRGSSGETLNPLERERFIWSHVEPAGTREVRLMFVWNLCVTWEILDETGVWPVTQGDRDLVPARPSTRWTLGRVDSRFVWEFIYRIACWRDRRSTSLKDMFWGVYLFLLFVYFVISVVVLISKIMFSSSKFSLFIF